MRLTFPNQDLKKLQIKSKADLKKPNGGFYELGYREKNLNGSMVFTGPMSNIA